MHKGTSAPLFVIVNKRTKNPGKNPGDTQQGANFFNCGTFPQPKTMQPIIMTLQKNVYDMEKSSLHVLSRNNKDNKPGYKTLYVL